jgi:hypothetical protein
MTQQTQISRRTFIKGAQAAALIPIVGFSGTAAGFPNGLSRDVSLSLLTTWCDGLLAHQATSHGGLVCPACEMIHGRSFDALYPLLHVAHVTGEAKYLAAAIRVHAWSESLSLPNGCWLSNFGEQWHETTRFNATTLSEALRYHGAILDAATRARWTDRLASATFFLSGLMLPSGHDAATPQPAEITQQDLTMFAANTHNGLLYKTPYTNDQDMPCIQDTVTQAKALATLLDNT